ncbi:MAG: HNH endonuclease signature motif containing protein, partial [Actinomycetota bacterium]
TDKWRRWLIDDSSRKVIEAGSVRYRPSQALRDLVSGRDLTCTADTCTRPASNSQLDHAVDFDGSNTTPDNVHAVCGPDHLVVTAGHFLIDADEAGHISWVSTASGHSYPSHPDLLHEQPVKSVE